MSHTYRFQDSSLSPRQRAQELVALLTREEKTGMFTNSLDEVPRLGISATHFGVEIARGLVQRNNCRESTILPQPWGMAAMFDPALMEQLGDMAGDEVRVSSQMDPPSSLALFGPTVDMERDPRWLGTTPITLNARLCSSISTPITMRMSARRPMQTLPPG